MTTIEAFVEIMKAALTQGGASTNSSAIYLADEASRKKLLAGMEELYKKIADLHAGR